MNLPADTPDSAAPSALADRSDALRKRQARGRLLRQCELGFFFFLLVSVLGLTAYVALSQDGLRVGQGPGVRLELDAVPREMDLTLGSEPAPPRSWDTIGIEPVAAPPRVRPILDDVEPLIGGGWSPADARAREQSIALPSQALETPPPREGDLARGGSEEQGTPERVSPGAPKATVPRTGAATLESSGALDRLSATEPAGFQSRRGVLRLGKDHAWDVATVYREASLVWGLE